MKKQYDSYDHYIHSSAVQDVFPGFNSVFYDELAREFLIEENGKLVERDDVDMLEAARKVHYKI